MTLNPRFPHRVVIERSEGGSSFEEPVRTVVYDGECRNYRNQVVKDSKGVIVSDYIIAMPRAGFSIHKKDFITVYEGNAVRRGYVKDSYDTNFGTNIWWNDTSN